MGKNKFTTALIVLIIIHVTRVHAQTGSTYVFLKPIYAFSGIKSKLNETTITAQGITYTKGVYGSYGNGIGLQAGFGKMVNTNFGIEMAAEWLNGFKIHTGYNSSDSNSANGELSEKVKGLLLKPVLVLRSSGDLLSFYSKLGLAISVFSRHYADIDLSTQVNGQSFQLNTSQIDNFRTKVGFTAAFGLSVRMAQSIAITGELNGQMISLPIKSGHYTKYTGNGKDLLPSISTNLRSWTYEKSISTAPADPNTPGRKLYEPSNFSYIGIGIGVKYYF